MRIGDRPTHASSAPTKYKRPAEELYHAVLDAFDDASMLARLALASALEGGERNFAKLPDEVRALFESVVDRMGIGD